MVVVRRRLRDDTMPGATTETKLMNKTTLATAILATLFLTSFTTAQTAEVTEYGPSCGLTASGSITPNGASRRITLTVSNAPPRTTVLFMVSGAPADIPLTVLGSSCSLLLDTVPFSQTHMTGSDGRYTFSKALGQIYPIDSYVQFMTVEFIGGELVLRTSNGLRVTYV